MDDDCVPAPDALAAQLAITERAPVVLARMIDHDTGEITDTQGWCGVLLAREVVEAVGVPDAGAVLVERGHRVPPVAHPARRVPRRTVHRRRDRGAPDTSDAAKPAWKYYYEARNQVYYRLVTQRPPSKPVPRRLTARVRAGARRVRVGKLAARAVLRERTQRCGSSRWSARHRRRRCAGRLGRTVRGRRVRPTPRSRVAAVSAGRA